MALETRRIQFAFRRSESDRAIVEGIAYLALDPPDSMEVEEGEARLRVDSWGTWMRRATLEKFAHDFLTYGRAVDSHHDHGPVGNVVESYLTREGNPDYPADVWVVRSRVYDAETLAEIDRGELTGFSIEFFSELKVRTLLVNGAKVRTGEIIAPIPIFLSMVERPAIGQPFAAVERRAAPEGALPELAESSGRVTRFWRCAMDETTATGTQALATPTAANPVTDVVPAQRAEPAAALPALAAEVAQAVAPSLRQRAAEALGTERCLELQKRAEAGSFAAAWAVSAPRAATWATFWEALYLLESILCNIRWGGGTSEEQYAAVAEAVAEYSEAISAITAAGGVTVAMRTRQQRAGAKHSKATLAKFDEMHGGLTTVLGVLDGLRGTEAEEDVAEEEVAARSQRDAEFATLRSQVAALSAEHATRGTELEATRATLAATAAAQKRAEERVAELEARRPPARSRTPEGDGDEPAEGTASKRSSGPGWGLFRTSDE